MVKYKDLAKPVFWSAHPNLWVSVWAKSAYYSNSQGEFILWLMQEAFYCHKHKNEDRYMVIAALLGPLYCEYMNITTGPVIVPVTDYNNFKTQLNATAYNEGIIFPNRY